jgi:alpha-D-ribose 1-methylphosphonate 5-triphosphate synthase subunit PhnL
VLKVENLSKRFTLHVLDGKQICGFENVSFSLPASQALGIAGPSGTGKSSILKCIHRTYLSTTGTIHYQSAAFGEVEITNLPENQMLDLRHREIGYVTQFLKVIPRITAVDLVAEPLIHRGTAHDDAREQARELLRRLHIGDALIDAYPATFSGGEKQRVNLARGIISKPRLLLLDEPTASLDRASMERVVELLLELKQQGTTMIAIFHDMQALERLTDQVYTVKPVDGEDGCECQTA